MRRLKPFLRIGLFLLLIVSPAGWAMAEDAGLRITEMAVTTKIVRGNPIDSVRRISSASVKALYCFTRINFADDEETTVTHIWYRDNVKVGEYELPVKGKRWRTFSRKTIEKGWSGDWRVEALDSEGNLLKTVTFRMN
ncbi:MAG: hypothetical protein FD174_2384 [Geobacteraceae bacterium]|nr:MAG: hypothetical protein FD174_2384 [Geobacteraceae bacterium]